MAVVAGEPNDAHDGHCKRNEEQAADDAAAGRGRAQAEAFDDDGALGPYSHSD